MNVRRRRLLAAVAFTAACGGEPGPIVEITVPAGATMATVADTLVARGVVRGASAFTAFARVRGDDRRVKAGTYLLPTHTTWRDALGRLTRGEVLTVPMTIPEGFRIAQMAPRIAAITGVDEERVREELAAEDLHERLGLPGPGVEGYLFPDTYRFAPGVPIDEVLLTMAGRYRQVWTPERRARLDSLGMSESELVTLASIIQAEARRAEEMPLISSVYHNRLRDGWLLQADPTVLFALGGARERLLYAAIDSVADHPYNTYTQPGLPPGPIGAAGEEAIVAALHPAEADYMFFVARPDGSHVFTRTLAEHNRAKAAAREFRGADGGAAGEG